MEIRCKVIHPNPANPNGYDIINDNFIVPFFPVPGLNPAYEVLVIRTPFAIPPYDTRLFNLVTAQQPSEVGVFDAEHPTQRMWLTTYSLQPVDAVELEKAVDEAEQMANLNQIPTQQILKKLAIAVSIADRRARGLVITPAMETESDEFHVRAQKIWENNLINKQKKAALQAGQPVNLDEGWQ